MPGRTGRGRSPRNRRGTAGDPDDPALGIDIGGTKVVAVLLGAHGRVLARSDRIVLSRRGPDAVVDAAAAAARSVVPGPRARPRSVGVSVAGQVDPSTGTVLYAPNLRWRHVRLGPLLSRRLGAPAHVVNDARAATFAEWSWGAGAGLDDVFCLWVGTGIGGSAVVDGRLLEGGLHAAGEVGHMPIVSGGRRCTCPGRGCFEAYAGGWGIASRACEAVRARRSEGVELVRRAGRISAIRAETVFGAARAGDPLARRLVLESGRYLADGSVAVVNAFNPRTLVLGGGVLDGWPAFRSVVARAVRTRCQPPAAAAHVVRARLGDDAPAVGAAALARGSRRTRAE
jgi:glucokinase